MSLSPRPQNHKQKSVHYTRHSTVLTAPLRWSLAYWPGWAAPGGQLTHYTAAGLAGPPQLGYLTSLPAGELAARASDPPPGEPSISPQWCQNVEMRTFHSILCCIQTSNIHWPKKARSRRPEPRRRTQNSRLARALGSKEGRGLGPRTHSTTRGVRRVSTLVSEPVGVKTFLSYLTDNANQKGGSAPVEWETNWVAVDSGHSAPSFLLLTTCKVRYGTINTELFWSLISSYQIWFW